MVIGVDANKNCVRLEDDRSIANSAKQKHAGKILRTELGDESLEATFVEDADVVVLSPGVPLTNPMVEKVMKDTNAKKKIEIISELAFAMKHIPDDRKIKKVAITGTNGKSTICQFSGQLIERANSNNKVFVGGNIGVPLSTCALEFVRADYDKKNRPYDYLVVELSSYQLEHPGLKNLKFDAACVTSLTPDHLERHGSMRNYTAIKASVFGTLRGSRCLALMPSQEGTDTETFEMLEVARRKVIEEISDSSQLSSTIGGVTHGVGTLPGVVVDTATKEATIQLDLEKVSKQEKLNLTSLSAVGQHNLRNAAVAAILVHSLDPSKFSMDELTKGVAHLEPPPHRMQRVYMSVSNDVEWIDDSKATNVESAIAGLSGYDKSAIVLLGGVAKTGMGGFHGLGFGKLTDCLKQHKGYVCFGQSGGLIAEELVEAGAGVPLAVVDTMREAVEVAKGVVTDGNAVVLSPACASFDEFRNFEHRGEVFKQLAKGEEVEY